MKEKREHRILRRMGRSATAILCAGALGVGLMPATAFAALGSLSNYDAPTSSKSIDSNYVTIGTRNTGNSGEILGLTDVTYGVKTYSTLTDAQKSNLLGLYGTNLNSNASQYWYNYFYNLNAGTNAVAATDAALPSGMQKPDTADTAGVSEYGGVSSTMYHRPDILMGCDSKSFASGGAIVLKDSSKAVSVSKASLATSGYSDQVNLINSFTSSSNYYQQGDGSYDPYYVEFATFYGDKIDSADGKATTGAYSVYTNINNLYRLAAAAEGVLKSNSSKKVRYGDPESIAEKYEAYMRGLQLYVLSKIDSGSVKKRSVAIIKSIDTTAKTATCYKSAEEGSVECGDGATSNISAATEILQNVCNNVAGTHSADGTTDGSSWVSSIDASKLMSANAIYLNSASDEAALKQLLSDSGYTDESKYPSIFTQPTSLSDGWGNGGSTPNVGVYLGFAYPELINPLYTLAYYLTNFAHVSSDSTTLSNVLGYLTSGMSMPSGVATDLSGYDESAIQNAINTGLQYYGVNKATISSAHPTLTLTSNVLVPKMTTAIKAKSVVTKTYKVKQLKKAKRGFSLKSDARISVSSKMTPAYVKTAGSTKLTVGKTGKVIIKKGTKRGTYRIRVKISTKANSQYTAAAKVILIKVVVKK